MKNWIFSLVTLFWFKLNFKRNQRTPKTEKTKKFHEELDILSSDPVLIQAEF